MASATGIPQQTPIDPDTDGQVGDTEPLLGRPGDVSQRDEAPIIKNLVLGMFPAFNYTASVSRCGLCFSFHRVSAI